MSSAYSWDVYAESLTYLGYGYPLWCPDTWNNGKPWDLNVGDVGWLRNGQFCPLLRTTATDAAQQPFRTLPEGHSPLVMARGALSEYPERFSRPTIFHSNTINTSMVMGEVSVSPADFGIGGSFSFKSVEGKGALLMLSPRAEETIFQSATTVVNYMRANHKKWEDFANDPHGLGLNLEPEDIIFVTGMIKTVDWGITTFTSMQREVEASISCTLGGVGSASISAHVTNRSATNLYPKAGPSSSWGRSPAPHLPTPTGISSDSPFGGAPPSSPVGSQTTSTTSPEPPSSPSRLQIPIARPSGSSTPPRRPSASATSLPTPPVSPASAASSQSPPKADQCIFLHYYKLKRRAILGMPPRFELKGAAGPHELPRGPGDPGAGMGVLADVFETADDEDEEEAEFEMMPPKSKHFDPVDALLDYILKKSSATVAIASDLDLYELFGRPREAFPRASEIAEALEILRPGIVLDDAGEVGTVLLPSAALAALRRPRPTSLPAQPRRVDLSTPGPEDPAGVTTTGYSPGNPHSPSDLSTPGTDDYSHANWLRKLQHKRDLIMMNISKGKAVEAPPSGVRTPLVALNPGVPRSISTLPASSIDAGWWPMPVAQSSHSGPGSLAPEGPPKRPRAYSDGCQ